MRLAPDLLATVSQTYRRSGVKGQVARILDECIQMYSALNGCNTGTFDSKLYISKIYAFLSLSSLTICSRSHPSINPFTRVRVSIRAHQCHVHRLMLPILVALAEHSLRTNFVAHILIESGIGIVRRVKPNGCVPCLYFSLRSSAEPAKLCTTHHVRKTAHQGASISLTLFLRACREHVNIPHLSFGISQSGALFIFDALPEVLPPSFSLGR